MAKWPNVPACYGWLSLDRRGRWRLQGKPVTHPGLRRLLDENYVCGTDGSWWVQNGPQRVFVALEYMPLVLHLDGSGALRCHTGRPAGEPSGVWFDEQGSVLIDTPAGPGLLDDRDLAAFVETCRDARGQAVDEATLLAALEGQVNLHWRGLAIGRLARSAAAGFFGFDAEPAP